MDQTPNGRGQSRHHLFNEIDASLKRLQLDYIDLYQLHGFDPLTPFEESLSAWLLAKPAVSSVIIGAKSALQLRDNIASTRVQLSAAELEALDAVSQLPAEYPGWMLSLQGQYRNQPPVNA